MLGLIHLYCTDPHKALGAEDLEFTVAVAKQLGFGHRTRCGGRSRWPPKTRLAARPAPRRERAGRRQPGDQVASKSKSAGSPGQTPPCSSAARAASARSWLPEPCTFRSQRKEGPFICLNCAAITETLLESELFGHEKGAFTGATDKKIGKFEAANHGTIFLDEIGEMAIHTQAKLCASSKGTRSSGSAVPRADHVDVRVVAATNQPLEKNLQDGKFRRDLFYPFASGANHASPRSVSVPRTCRCWRTTFSSASCARRAEDSGLHTRGLAKDGASIIGPATSASCAMSSSARSRSGRGPVLDVQDIWLSSLETGRPAPLIGDAAAYEPVSLEEVEKRFTSCAPWSTRTGTRARQPPSSKSNARLSTARSRATTSRKRVSRDAAA